MSDQKQVEQPKKVVVSEEEFRTPSTTAIRRAELEAEWLCRAPARKMAKVEESEEESVVQCMNCEMEEVAAEPGAEAEEGEEKAEVAPVQTPKTVKPKRRSEVRRPLF